MRLHTRSWGEPSGRLIVLLHGITGSSASWVGAGEELGRLGYFCLAPDLRGHGESPKPESGYSLHELVGDIGDSVRNDPYAMIGHSLGGTLAVLATQGRVVVPRYLVLEDPVLVMPSADHASRMLDIVDATPRGLDAYLAANPGMSREDAGWRLWALDRLAWPQVRRIFVGNAPWDLTPLVKEVAPTTPTLCLLPEESEWVSRQAASELEEILGRTSMVVVPDAGHNIHRDNLGGFVGALTSWLPSPSPGRTHRRS